MPAIPAGTIYRHSPDLVTNLVRHSVGWMDSRKDGPCFVVVRISSWATYKVLDRFPLTEEGWARAWTALLGLDSDAARKVREVLEKTAGADAARTAERERQASTYEAFVRARKVTVFRSLGVQVLVGDDKVYTIGSHDDTRKLNDSRVLGQLAEARAMVTDGAQAWSPGRAMFLPISFAGLATKTQADAAIVFPDGTVHVVALNGNSEVREAQKQVVQFNALADACTPMTTEISSDPATRLRKLQELRDAGLLTEEEYGTKRAQVIASI
jgi:Short C-terminal domain